MNSVNATAETAVLAKTPFLRITPPSRWWAIPFGELWAYRELLYFFVWRDIKIRYKQTAIGAAWAVLQPFLTMLVFSLFFGKLAHIPSDGLPYAIFYYSALLPWMYFAAALQNATNTIVENQRLITKVYFPRLALPLSSVLSGLVDFGVSFLMFVVMMVYYGIRPGAAMLWLPAFLAAGDSDGAGRGIVAFGAERDLSRCALRGAVSGAILVVRFAGGVPEFARAGQMALAVRTESDGGRDRRISLVAHGTGRSAGADVCCLRGSGDRGSCWAALDIFRKWKRPWRMWSEGRMRFRR